MKLLICCTIVLSLIATPTFASSSQSKKAKCLKVREDIAKIQQKMRQPYSAKQGRKYQDNLHKLYKAEFKYCA
ncbi:hypothetical protein C5F64_14010 [Photobacterium damselae subsp. damselae]|uniref:hypothetical protein n=1 Tax=Photobacterium damselae TaxID=38293 RepID=UPI000D06DF8A|nr:hypothetical protein [Photobacterium damselae]NVO58932.1 hypothetical protein [Photobacterium damselae subsp. damselae]PSB83940.1 hypothetical protein C5F64_14010 [Photobacterium damselae subsp. damselae]